MTGRRAKSQANRQRRNLAALADARQRRPGPDPATLAVEELPMLAVLDALEHAGNLARLARASSVDPLSDSRFRRVLVIVNAIAQAIVDDVKAGDDTATSRIYLAVSAMQNHSKGAS